MNSMICTRMTLCALFISLVAGSAGLAQSRIAIPSYQDPGSPQWNAWISPGSSSIGIMIVNENNGDDLSYYPEIAAAIRQARRKGIFVVGYVYTGYGQRDSAIVRKDIDGVFQNYLVDGIFFDEVPTDCNAATPKSGTNYRYYQDLANYVRSRHAGGRIVILNPGTQPPNDCWMSLANILVSAESNGIKDYTQNYQDQAWFHRYSPNRFWHIVYNVAEKSNFDKVVSMSRERGAGWVYITDGGSNNPYAQPPAYWSLETSQIAGQAVQDPYATYRPPSQDENGNRVAARFSIRWTTANDSALEYFHPDGSFERREVSIVQWRIDDRRRLPVADSPGRAYCFTSLHGKRNGLGMGRSWCECYAIQTERQHSSCRGQRCGAGRCALAPLSNSGNRSRRIYQYCRTAQLE